MTKPSSKQDELFEGITSLVVGHIVIRDKVTGEILLSQRDNFTESVALKGKTDATD